MGIEGTALDSTRYPTSETRGKVAVLQIGMKRVTKTSRTRRLSINNSGKTIWIIRLNANGFNALARKVLGLPSGKTRKQCQPSKLRTVSEEALANTGRAIPELESGSRESTNHKTRLMVIPLTDSNGSGVLSSGVSKRSIKPRKVI